MIASNDAAEVTYNGEFRMSGSKQEWDVGVGGDTQRRAFTSYKSRGT